MKALLLLLALAICAPPVGAQEEAAPPIEPAAEAVAPDASSDAEADDVGIVEEAVQPGDYVYETGGRRDPFVSLLANVAPGAGGDDGVRLPGMPGFLIQEMTLKGIVADRSGFIAMLEATDGKSYFARVGQQLYDGTITAMDAATVSFHQDVRDPLARERIREVVKSLYTFEESR